MASRKKELKVSFTTTANMSQIMQAIEALSQKNPITNLTVEESAKPEKLSLHNNVRETK